MPRRGRLLQLLQLLRRHTRPVTAAALAGELGVSERTVYRDIQELVAQGASISGAAGVGYVLRPGLFLPPLMLDEDEAEALVLGLRYGDQRGDATLRRAAADVLAKVTAVVSPRAKESLLDPIVLPGPPAPAFPDDLVDLETLRGAIRQQRKLRLEYVVDGARTERMVWPLAIGFMDLARALVAWCELRDGYRTFRTDRIARCQVTGERYPGKRTTLLRAWRAEATRAPGS
jgi:predicted DNA-binding transcriptional regulator YafY